MSPGADMAGDAVAELDGRCDALEGGLCAVVAVVVGESQRLRQLSLVADVTGADTDTE
jgi:hypothetical protein